MSPKATRRGQHPPAVIACPLGHNECEAGIWRERYEGLRERILEVGFMAFDMLDEKQKYKLVVMEFLRDKYGDLKVSTLSLHSLKPEVKRNAMDYLYAVLQGNPRRKNIVHEVFRTARKRRRDCFNDYGSEIP